MLCTRNPPRLMCNSLWRRLGSGVKVEGLGFSVGLRVEGLGPGLQHLAQTG